MHGGCYQDLSVQSVFMYNSLGLDLSSCHITMRTTENTINNFIWVANHKTLVLGAQRDSPVSRMDFFCVLSENFIPLAGTILFWQLLKIAWGGIFELSSLQLGQPARECLHVYGEVFIVVSEISPLVHTPFPGSQRHLAKWANTIVKTMEFLVIPYR